MSPAAIPDPTCAADPSMWHSADRHARTRARSYCYACAGMALCARHRDDMLANGARLWGVWAGDDYGMKNGHAEAATDASDPEPAVVPPSCLCGHTWSLHNPDEGCLACGCAAWEAGT